MMQTYRQCISGSSETAWTGIKSCRFKVF